MPTSTLWKALNYETYWIFLFGLDARGVPVITFHIDYNIRNKKKELYLGVNVFSTKVLIGDTIFYVSNWTRDRHFTWSYEPREGLACCSAKGVPSFLGYFKTLSIGPAPGIEPATSRSAVNALYRLS